jgi:polygalacturonase
MKRVLVLCVLVLLKAGVCAQAAIFDVRQYGATGDGHTKDTAAIQKAIEMCGKAGGGTVSVPPGRYFTGTIQLRSNVALHIEAGATLLGSTEPEDYPLVPSPWKPGVQEIASLIRAENASNIALTGRGTIDGQGEAWWKRQRMLRPKSKTAPGPIEVERSEIAKIAHGRPHLIKLVNCKHVLLEDLTLLNSPSWTVNPVFSEFITVRNLTLVNPPDSPNTDGINPESCRNVHISECNIDVGDDCITIKSGTDEVGRRAGRACENITVTNCTMLHGHGGLVIGSEMSGGAKNVTISNCVFQHTLRGIRIKSQRGRGGVVERISASNIVMEDVQTPVSISMYYSGGAGEDRAVPVGEGTPLFRDISLSNILARGAKVAGEILGLPEMPVQSVTLDNVKIEGEKSFVIRHAKDIAFHRTRIEVKSGPPVVQNNVTGFEQ